MKNAVIWIAGILIMVVGFIAGINLAKKEHIKLTKK